MLFQLQEIKKRFRERIRNQSLEQQRKVIEHRVETDTKINFREKEI